MALVPLWRLMTDEATAGRQGPTQSSLRKEHQRADIVKKRRLEVGPGRLAAFSDGVMAIILTIMVLEMKVPHGESFEALRPLFHVFSSYVLSFIIIGMYWNHHHHLLHACKFVSGGVLWANLHLLFWLSLIPFATSWMGESKFSAVTSALYGFILLMAGCANYILQKVVIAAQGPDSRLKAALGKDWKGKLSPLITIGGIASSFWVPWLAQIIYLAVALIWLVPDRRIERKIAIN